MRFLLRPVVFAAVAAALLGAWRPAADPLALKEGSRLWFAGTSTVRSWSCEAPRIVAAIDAAAGAPSAVLGGTKAVRTVELTFPVASLDCDNRTMNDHMRKALNAERHPQIVFRLSGYELTAGAATLQGTLAINGQSRPVTLPVALAAADGALRVTGTYALKMTDWGVEPPRLMMGTLKVGEAVTVQFDLLLHH